MRLARPLTLLALAGLPLAFCGCGILGRPMNAMRDLRDVQSPSQMDALRGRDPMVTDLWYVSAIQTPDQARALAILQRGQRFHPHDARVIIPQYTLLSELGRPDEQLETARRNLAVGQPPEVRAWSRLFSVDAYLALDDPDAAAAEALRLGGERGSDPILLGQAWARVALEYEYLGRPYEADAALDASLAQGPTGISQILREIDMYPERQAAARAVTTRAAERFPLNADVQLLLVLDMLRVGELEGAEIALDNLPPAAARLEPQITLLQARLQILQGNVDEGLPVVLLRLDTYRADPGALLVLIECWELHGQPGTKELRARLKAAQPYVRFHPLLSAKVNATLEQIAENEDATEPDPPAPDAPTEDPPAEELP